MTHTTTNPPTRQARQTQKSTWRRWLPYALGAFLLVAIIGGLRPKPIEVETGRVSREPLTVSVLEEGKTRIRHRFTVSPPVAGFLNRVPLRAGDRLEAGKTVLAILQAEPASFLNPRARAEAEARVRTAEAAKMRSESELERARVALELAEKEKARADALKLKGAISLKEWDTAENELSLLTRQLHTADFAARVGAFELAQAQATLVQTQDLTPGEKDALKIVAPISGYVLQVFEESARIVSAGTPIMEVGDPTDLEAEIELLSSDAVGVQPGAPVSIEQWGGEEPLRGKVTVIEPGGFTKISALGVEEQRVKVRVEFSDPIPEDHPLGDRFRVEARITTWSGDNVLQMPTGALFRRGADWMTFVQSEGAAHLCKVQIGRSNGANAEVHSGVTRGELVILHPPDSVSDGRAVRTRQPSEGR